MSKRVSNGVRKISWAALAALLGALIAQSSAQAVTVTVKDDNGAPVTHGFRWLVEEDNTYLTIPGTQNPNAPLGAVPGDPSYTLGVNIHKSHSPTVCAGDTSPDRGVSGAPSSVTINPTTCPGFDPAKRYIVSVLPWHTSPPGTPAGAQGGYTMSGRNIAAGQASATVVVHNFAMPTAQLTAIVFEDRQPINGAVDQPAESGLADFELILSDPIGKMQQDAFGNPLGTTYKYKYTTPDGRPADAAGNALLQGQEPEFDRDPTTGAPTVDWMGDSRLTSCPGGALTNGQYLKPDGTPYNPYQLHNCVDPYTLTPLAIGESVVRYLPQNKHTIEHVPPAGKCGSSDDSHGCADMLLTATLEGTRGNDVWVRAGEPRYNIALGQLNWLVFDGFVHPMNGLANLPNPTGATGTITGQVVYAHDSHPPLSPGLSPGLPVPDAYVGLNNLSGNDEQVYTAPCDPVTGAFTISGVPPGTYQLVMWDKPINAIIDFRTLTVPQTGGTVALGQVAVYGWFGNVIGTVFSDANQNGFQDVNEPGIPNIPVNMRFTDGSLYGPTITGPDGTYSFPEYFTWWRFLVPEVDNSRFKPTGITSVVDDGGPLPANAYGALGINPQLQPGGLPYRTQTGRVTTQAMQLFQDMTAKIDFGKTAYGPGENGGVRGIVNYATTRTEEDPRFSTMDKWEPAVPNVTVRLHQAQQFCADDACTACSAGAPAGATVLNQCWAAADAAPFPLTTKSSSWNDNLPTGCVGSQGQVSQGPLLWPNPEIVNGFAIPSCAETFLNWDQTRPGIFDGQYAFDTMPNGSPIPPGDYIVEVVPPAGYEVLKWGDRNIEFGDPKIPFLLQPPPCVGAPYDVPQFHALFPDQEVPTLYPPAYDAAGNWVGAQAAGCEQKYIPINPGANAIANFNLLTEVPKASRIWGTVWNDLFLEFNPASPNASGNFAVPWLPVAIRDWKGTEVARFYTDQWGHFDGVVPANYDIAPPVPLGLVLALYTIAPNDPGPIDPSTGLKCDPVGPQCITDPWFDPNYSQEVIRENWEFYPGKTTFIDTIVLPIAGFQGNRIPLNCAYTDHTPEIKRVSDVFVPAAGGPITITSVGSVLVPNPNATTPALVTWDHGFGTTKGTVTIGGTAVPPANITAWTSDNIYVNVPAGRSGQLVVTRGDNAIATTVGITLHTANPAQHVTYVDPPPLGCVGLACGVIQPAIDAAHNGDIIVLRPSDTAHAPYQENVNFYKPVTLQGYGAAVTIIDGTAALGNFPLKQQQFNQLVALSGNGTIGLVPNQASNFTLEQGAGILVAGCDYTTTPTCSNNFNTGHAQIDGISVTGASEAGGGILINGFAPNLKVTNNEIFANQGSIGGGIRAGESALVGAGNPNGSSFNANLVVDHNRIARNGSLTGGGGGLALYGGTDNYQVTNNFICGNFSAVYGGGIGHYGLSDGGLIEHNKIVSNESFDEGGGIHIAGELPAAGTALTLGSGSVKINANLIEGNKGGDDGGGIRTLTVNGQDVVNHPLTPSAWYQIDIFNNMVVNNATADHGGGASFDDTIKLFVVGNTFANNDSTATAPDAFGGPCVVNSPPGQVCPIEQEASGGLVTSTPQVGGMATFAYSAALATELTPYCASAGRNPQWCTGMSTNSGFSNPVLIDDIFFHNRSFYWDAVINSGLGGLLPDPVSPNYWELAVYGTLTPQTMSPTYSLLTNAIGATPSATNQIGVNPVFLIPYVNVFQATSKGAAFGNTVTTMFTPNGLQGDYHIATTSPAVNRGSAILYPPLQSKDYDGDTRLAPVDVGADQTAAARPALLVTPNALSFGNAQSGAQPLQFVASSAPVVVTNATSSSLNVSHTLTGADASLFAVQIGGSPWRSGVKTIAANGTLPLTVVFAPPANARAGAKSATLTFSAPGQKSVTVALTAVVQPRLTVSQSALSFSAARGTTSTAPLVVTNGTGSPVSISRSIPGTNSSMFRTSIGKTAWNSGTRSVPAHGTLTIDVTFAPPKSATVGTKTATLSISSPAQTTVSVSLTGTAK